MTKWQEQSDKFHKFLEYVGEIHDRKGRDYGTDNDQYANIRASEEFGIPAWVGSVIRANDKMARIKSFLKNGKLENESLEDTLLDAAVYFLNAYILFKEKLDADNGIIATSTPSKGKQCLK
jgi:hypothetical protein